MQFCSRCLYPANHPLNLVFDDDGVCSGCRVHEEKDSLDWQQREQVLRNILDNYRDKSGTSYDCIIPVSGARDSYFIVDLIKRKFGMRPLLVNYNRHYNTNRGIRNLAYLRTQLDCDFVQQVIQPQKVSRIMRETLHRLGNFHWHAIAGQTVYPVQVAVRLKVPLIIWGAHQGIDQVGMYSHLDEVEMTRKYRKEHDLMDCEAEDLLNGVEGLTEKDLIQYFYPHDKEIERVGVRGIYLNNYIRWDTKDQHERMLDKHGYETAGQQRNFDLYNDVDCLHHNGAHDWVKYRKFGYGKAVDYATREIRLKRLTRDQAIDLVADYQDQEPDDLEALLTFMDMSRATFDAQVDQHRDPRAWRKDTDGNWELLHSVADTRGQDAHSLLSGHPEPLKFRLMPNKDPHANEHEYVLLKRGFVDGVPAILRDGLD